MGIDRFYDQMYRALDQQQRRFQEQIERKQARFEREMQRQKNRYQHKIERQQRILEIEFGKHHRRSSGRKTRLNDDQERIIKAAVELLDEIGLNDLSLRKLANKLNFKAPAIYWHFKNKEVLIDYMADEILRTEFADLEAKSDDEFWQDWFIEVCKRLRKAMLSHQDGARIVAGAHFYPAVSLMYLFEVSLESLISDGVSPEQARLIVTTAIQFVFGNAIEQQSGPSEEQVEQVMHMQESGIFPLFAKRISEVLQHTEPNEEDFEAALRLIIGYSK